MRTSHYLVAGLAVAVCLTSGVAWAQSQSDFRLRQPTSPKRTVFRSADYSDYYDTDSDGVDNFQTNNASNVDVAYSNSGGCDSCNDCDDGCDDCCGGPWMNSPCDFFSGADCCSCRMFGPDEAWTMFTDDAPFSVGGWQQLGYTDNVVGLSVFNRVPNRFNLNQSWFFLNREADGSNGIGFGGRMDMFYGTDGYAGQAFGNNPGRFDFQNGWDQGSYAWAMPQLYGEVAVGDLSVKIGHFWTIIGYEVVGAPGNFFFSHAFTHEAAEPFTHTGALAEYSAGEDVTLYGGWTAGYDTGFDSFNNGSNFLGGAAVQLFEGVTGSYMLGAGNLGVFGDGYSHSLIVVADVTDNVQYVAESDLIHGSIGYDAVGFNNYLFYNMDDCWALGGRAEWFKLNGTSMYEMTAGVNYKPHANLFVRPEFRYQWSPGGGLAAVGAAENQGIFGIDTFVTY